MKTSALLPWSLLLLAGAAHAQPVATFAVASVKLNHSASNAMGGTIGFKRDGSVSMRNVTARTLIEMAYGLPDYRLSPGPAWTTSTGYDVDAKPEQPVGEDQAELMLQALLAERFSLRVHHDRATVSGFSLVVDKGGSKLHPTPSDRVGFRMVTMEQTQGPGTMAMFALALKALLRAPVEDHTGLNGVFDIQLKTNPEGAPAVPSAASGDAGGLTPSEPATSIFAALKQQLGLRLEATKVPIDVIVIDRVEKPTEN